MSNQIPSPSQKAENEPKHNQAQTTQLNTGSSQQKVQSKPPLLFNIITWLMLAGVWLSIAGGTAGLLLAALLEKSFIFAILAIFEFIIFFGLIWLILDLRKMRRWALYVYSILTAASIIYSIYSFATKGIGTTEGLVSTAISTIILIYFWTLNKKFV